MNTTSIWISDGKSLIACNAIEPDENDTKLLYAYPSNGGDNGPGLRLYFRGKEARNAGLKLIEEAVQRGENYIKIIPSEVRAAHAE